MKARIITAALAATVLAAVLSERGRNRIIRDARSRWLRSLVWAARAISFARQYAHRLLRSTWENRWSLFQQG